MITSVLQGLLRHLGKRAIVVVTDRYPPNAYGGAELSLHTVLAAMDRKDDLLVVTFEDRIFVPRAYVIDDVTVLALPRQAAWPLQSLPHSAVTKLERFARPIKERLGSPFARNSLNGGDMAPEDRAMLQEAQGYSPRGGIVADFAEYSSGLAVALLRETFRACDPELIHADNYRSILAVSVASVGLRAKRVGTVRDNRFHCVRYSQAVMVRNQPCASCDLGCAPEDLPQRPRLQHDLLEKTRDFRQGCLKSFDRVVVTSRYLEREMAAIVDSARLTRIPNAPESLEVASEHMRGVAELPRMNVLIVGMLTENKGQLQFVRQLARLITKVPSVVVHLAGRGARLQEAIQKDAAKNGHGDRIVFHGYVGRERLYELYRQCQIVAIPALWPEPFGRVPLEAAIARRPVVAFAVGGLVESIVHDETGFLVPPGDFNAMQDAIATLANNPALRYQQGEAALKRVLSHYDIGALKARLTEAWAETLKT